jgi:hypothetical protein
VKRERRVLGLVGNCFLAGPDGGGVDLPKLRGAVERFVHYVELSTPSARLEPPDITAEGFSFVVAQEVGPLKRASL